MIPTSTALPLALYHIFSLEYLSYTSLEQTRTINKNETNKQKNIVLQHSLTWSNTFPLYTLMGYMVPKVIKAIAIAEAVSTA